MVDSPARTARVPWLQTGDPHIDPQRGLPVRAADPFQMNSAGAAAEADSGAGPPPRGALRRYPCLCVATLGVLTAAALAVAFQVRGQQASPRFEVIFEGAVPREQDFSLHIGFVCFGAAPDPSRARDRPAGALRLQLEPDESWREASATSGAPGGEAAGVDSVNLSDPVLRRAAEESEGAPWTKGELAWLLYDDREEHWGSARKHWGSLRWGSALKHSDQSALEQLVTAANSASRVRSLPWRDNQEASEDFAIREADARHWHIVLSGSGLRSQRPATRFRVLASAGLRTFDGDELRPGSCPEQPVVWLEQQGFKAYHHLQV